MPVNKTNRGFEFYWEAEVTVSGVYGGEMDSTVEISLSENDLLEMLGEIRKAKGEEKRIRNTRLKCDCGTEFNADQEFKPVIVRNERVLQHFVSGTTCPGCGHEQKTHVCKLMPGWCEIVFNDMDEAVLKSFEANLTVEFCPFCGVEFPRAKTYDEVYVGEGKEE